MQKTKKILTQLKTEGGRVTTLRRVILYTMEKLDTPLSALDILSRITEMGLSANKTTIYRELEFLLNKKIIETVQLRGREQKYELVGEHHHHLICEKCSEIQEMPLSGDLDATEEKIFKKFNFKVQSHSLEFYGLCAKCQ